MLRLLFLLLLLPLLAPAHPGIGIVRDSRGNIYYSDLQQVWKITNGKKTIAVPAVHSHELYIDAADNLYGEHERYEGEATNRFHHYQWVLRPDGALDTVSPLTEAYIQNDYSLARDLLGNEYYTRLFLRRPDSNHIYKRSPDGRETVFARGNFKGVGWLHPQGDGSLLFVQHNNIYRADSGGRLTTLARGIGNASPSFAFAGNGPIVYGTWQDNGANVYVAVFSDQAVKKIAPNGTVSTYYTSTGNWAPTHGVFDRQGRLWVLESSDKNEVRVTMVPLPASGSKEQGHPLSGPWLIATIGAILLLLTYLYLRSKKRPAAYPLPTARPFLPSPQTTAMKSFLFALLLTATGTVSAQDKAPKAPIPDKNKPLLTVEAACGQCRFGLPGTTCDLAVRLNGKAYFVDGTGIDDHGDAHAEDGFCNAVRKAHVQGEVKDGRFKATYFHLLPDTTHKAKRKQQ